MSTRREFLRASAGAVALAAAGGCGEGGREPRWTPPAFRKPARSEVAILSATGYERPLDQALLDGIHLFDLDVRDRRVVLKPNLVEFDPDGVINTHPALLRAAVEVFRRLGAGEVVVAEGPGHRRDNEHLLEASGFLDMLRRLEVPYVDLNRDAVRPVILPSRFSSLGRLYLPTTVLDCDLLVSLPKLKTHHWAGVTLSMKNMFGIVPGSIYGWPKNALHWAGLQGSILDINAALALPRFNIVDGIVGMDGNGPIQGEPKPSGVLVFGADPVAVDATCARLMSIDPARVEYLRDAAAFLGNIEPERIEQRGELLEPLRRDYRVLESFREMKISSRVTAG